MSKGRVILFQMCLCFAVVGGCLIAYLEKQNELTELRLYVPKLSLEIKEIQEVNTQLKYQIQEFEQPDNLMKLASQGQFAHLKHPLEKEILVIQGGDPLQLSSEIEGKFLALKSKHTLAVGTQ